MLPAVLQILVQSQGLISWHTTIANTVASMRSFRQTSFTDQRRVLVRRRAHRLERLPQVQEQVDGDAGLGAGLLFAQVLQPQRRLDGRLLGVDRADGAQDLQPARDETTACIRAGC